MNHQLQHVVMIICDFGVPKEEAKPLWMSATWWGLFMLLLVSSAAGQTLTEPLHLAQLDHTSWSSRDGAPRNVSWILEDPDGTLWLASSSGLYTFDGKVFSVFRSQLNDPQLPAPPITTTYMATDGSLWIGYALGNIAEIRNHKVVCLYGEKDGLPVGTVWSIFQGPDRKLMAIAKGRLFQFDEKRWLDVTPNLLPLNDELESGFLDHTGAIWMVSLKFLWKMAAGEHHFTKISEAGGNAPTFAESSDGILWIGVNNPGQKFNRLYRVPESGGVISVRKILFGIGRLFAGPKDRLSICTRFGFVRLDPNHWPKLSLQNWSKAEAHDSDQWKTLGFEKYDHSDGLTSDAVRTVIQDHLHDIWLGTDNGVDRFRTPRLVPVIDHRILTQPIVTRCPHGDIWIASYFGELLSLHNGDLSDHGHSQAMWAYCDSDGTVWLSETKGLANYNGAAKTYFAPPAGIPALYNRQVIGTRSQGLFVSYTRNGLWRFAGGTWSRVKALGFPDETPLSLWEDPQKRLWAGFLGGRIAILDGKKGTTFRADSPDLLGGVEVFLGSTYGIAVGGMSGIALLRGDHLQALQVVDRTTVQGVSGLVEAPNGDLWLNGLHGIIRILGAEIIEAIRLPSYRMRTEIYSDESVFGPATQLFSVPSAVVDSHGVFWFATSNSVVYVDPKTVHPDTTMPILGDISTTVDGSPVPKTHEVEPGYHTVRIHYWGTYLTAPEKVTYRYKLIGADNTWQEVGDRSEAVYTGLGPGTYRFAVTASNGEGVWTQPDNSLQFTVLPSFYQRPIFLLLCVATALCLMWIAFRLRVRHVAAAIRQREEVRANERIRIARDLHDTFLQGVQSFVLRVDVAAKDLPEGNRTRKWLESSLLVADQVLAEGRDQVSHLRPANLEGISLSEAFEGLDTATHSKEQVRYSVTTEGDARPLNAAVQQELYYIGREAVMNAFRHSKASSIEVHLVFQPRAFLLRVTDDGQGFDVTTAEAKARNGHFGLRGIKERAVEIGAAIEYISVLGEGTKMILSVPNCRAYSPALPHHRD